jgi:hypothetical protein
MDGSRYRGEAKNQALIKQAWRSSGHLVTFAMSAARFAGETALVASD